MLSLRRLWYTGGIIHAGTNTVINCTFQMTCRFCGLMSDASYLTTCRSRSSHLTLADLDLHTFTSADLDPSHPHICRSRSSHLHICRSRSSHLHTCRSRSSHSHTCRRPCGAVGGASFLTTQTDSVVVRFLAGHLQIWSSWRCEDVDQQVWRCSITAAFLRRTLRRRSGKKLM